jgi:hypothetical protein
VRQRHASRLAELQRFDEAAAAFSALADDLAMDVGSYDVRALNARAGAALATALGGDAGGAMAIVAEMPPVDAVTGAIDARTEFRLARFVLFVTLERKLETLDEANAVLDLADAGATLDAELVRTIAWARISTASKLGDMREAIRYALDLHERETAAGIATESSAGITFLANLATVGDFDVWGFGTTDELLRDARRKVVEAEPRLAVFGWLHHTLTLPVARVRNAIAAIFVELEANREASRSVFSALLTAASSGVVTPQETRAWRAAWADVPLPSGVDAATLSAFADALIAAREGSREELAKLPSEVRAALESAIARAPEDDQHFVGPVLSEPSSD